MKSIQLLHHSITPFVPGVDPTQYEEYWHLKTARQLARRSHELEIECWCPEYTFDKTHSRVDEDGITRRLFPSRYVNFKLEFSLEMYTALKREIEQDDVIVHFHGIYNFHFYALAAAVGADTPSVAQSHGGSPARQQIGSGSLLLDLNSIAEYVPQHYSFRLVDEFFSLTALESQFLAAYSSARVSPMGVDFDTYRPMNRRTACDHLGAERTNSVTIVYLGALQYRKGVDVLLLAFSALVDRGHDVVLNIGGSGNHAAFLENLAARLGIADRVRFWGFIDSGDKTAFYNTGDVVCFPSREEPYGIVPVEALACKVPLVATDVGGVSDVATAFGGGSILVRPDSVSALATGLENAVCGGVDSDDIDRSAGEQRCGWGSIIENTLRTYSEVIGEPVS